MRKTLEREIAKSQYEIELSIRSLRGAVRAKINDALMQLLSSLNELKSETDIALKRNKEAMLGLSMNLLEDFSAAIKKHQKNISEELTDELVGNYIRLIEHMDAMDASMVDRVKSLNENITSQIKAFEDASGAKILGAGKSLIDAIDKAAAEIEENIRVDFSHLGEEVSSSVAKALVKINANISNLEVSVRRELVGTKSQVVSSLSLYTHLTLPTNRS